MFASGDAYLFAFGETYSADTWATVAGLVAVFAPSLGLGKAAMRARAKRMGIKVFIRKLLFPSPVPPPDSHPSFGTQHLYTRYYPLLGFC